METKTPKSDALIDQILEDLVPQQRTCKWSGSHPHCEDEFKITSEDISFLKMLRVPAPNFCPTCRRIRRLVHMSMMNLSKRPCEAPAHAEKMIAVFPEECPFPVYDYQYFIGDEFDPFSFGVTYDNNKSSMQTLFDLRKIFPMPSFLNRDPSSLNSEYSSGGRDNKNCYFTMGCYTVEDVWYSSLIHKSRMIMDSRGVKNSEFVYNGLFSDHIYKSSFVYFSANCTDSMFLFDCRNCVNCFGCANLRNAKYCVYNEQLSKEQYEAFIKSIHPMSHDALYEYKNKFWKLVKKLPMNGPHNVGSENVSGVNISRSKNLFDIVEADNSEHVRHAEGIMSHKDSMDIMFSGGHSSNLYGTINIGSQSSNVRFSVSCKFCIDSEFIFNSKNLSNCFMCFGLQNKSYCVLNTQYTSEEYFEIVDEIKSQMIQNGEYNDGLGLEFSAQAYNFSMAQIAYPLTNEEIEKLGGYVAKEQEINTHGLETLSKENLLPTIEETTDDIIEKAIICEISKRPFRIVASELSFYRQMGLPLPTMHPILRIEEQYRIAPNGKKYKAICQKCNKDIESIFNPDRDFVLYCEKCYQSEVY